MLPISWIDRVFAHMAGLYGKKFADLWGDTDLIAVKQLWAEKLGGFRDRPEAIKAALDALDDKPFPPTLPEFLRACRDAAKRVGTKHFALEHKLTPEEIERNRQRIAAMRERLTDKMTKTAQEPMK